MKSKEASPKILLTEGVPEERRAAYWYEQYKGQREENEKLKAQIKEMSGEIEELKESLKKSSNRDSQNSSKPPSADAHKKPNKEIKVKKKKQGPKYGHKGTTRNGFESIEHRRELELEVCPVCGKQLR